MTHKAKIFLTLLAMCSFIYQAYSQTKPNGYKLKANFTIGQSGHPNTPVQFPIGYTDASITPDRQESRLGYQISVAGLRDLNEVISIGLAANISKFGFIETGDELSFWTSDISRYIILREFKVYGIGITSGISILQNEVNTLSSFIGIEYQEFISTEGVYLWRESDNKSKFDTNLSVEYGHRLSSNMHLTVGLNSVISLGDFFTTIKYRPIRYGLSIGLEYDID